jgi:hypothetical protein
MIKLRNKGNQRAVLRAIHPNEGVLAWYASTLQQLLREAFVDAVLTLTPVLPEPIHPFIAQDSVQWFGRTWENGSPRYELTIDAAPTVTKVDKALKKWGDKWSKKFDKLSRDVSKAFVKRSFSATENAMRAAFRDAGFTVSFKPSRAVLESYKLVVADNVGLIRNLQQSLYSKIQQDTWASVRAGGDMATLSEKLHKSYGIESNRAALIARDQNNKAKAIIEQARRHELGLTQAIWQHSSGGKEPRPQHVAWGREGKVFDVSKGLFDEDEQQWVLPGQLINCRCTSRAIIPGFDE